MDDTFLRQAAALQANLKMLESQSASLTDLADMKELRQFKARLADYIDGHATAGNLPRDPFHTVERRLVAISKFFAAVDQGFSRLHTWKRDWIKLVPAVTLTDLNSASAELDALVAEMPQLQQSLCTMLSPLDWNTSVGSPDLHPELLACAQSINSLELPEQAKRRAFYDFAHGLGGLAEEVLKDYQAIRVKIRELIALHAKHAAALEDVELHLTNNDFRSAQQRFDTLENVRFRDLPYENAASGIKKLEALFREFTKCSKSTDWYLGEPERRAIEAELLRLRSLVTKPQSELGKECLVLLNQMESRAAEAKLAEKKRRIIKAVVATVFVATIIAYKIYISIER